MATFEGALRRIPLVRLVLPFIAGILISEEFLFTVDVLISISILFLGIVLLEVSHHAIKRYSRLLYVNGTMMIVIFFYLGLVLSAIHRQQFVCLPDQKSAQFIAQVTDIPLEKEKTFKISLDIFKKLDNTWVDYRSQVIAYIRKDSLLKRLSIGDFILVEASVFPVRDFETKGKFSYVSYLKHKQIYNQIFVRQGHWRVIHKQTSFSIKKLAFNFRDRISEIYASAHIKEEETSVLQALMLGVRSDISPGLLQAYSFTGAMHILAVSGLHVGILYLILSWILFFMNGKWMRFTRTLIIIVVVWFYAFMTGFSPSIERAAIMFSLIAISKQFHWASNIYNTLAATAFFILIIHPQDLYDIGFQLSFLAITGIVCLQQYFKDMLKSKYILVNKTYELLYVSVAAQLLTLPLAMYYFGQIPMYFLLTNLVAIPVSFVVMVLGIAVVPVFFISRLLFDNLAVILDYSVWLQDESILFISRLPCASLSFCPSQGFTMLMYVAILSLVLYFESRKTQSIV